MQPRPIRFFHGGEVVSLTGTPPDRTVLEWLREDAGCHGTKEGCAEGDCGACVVIVASLDPEPKTNDQQHGKRADGLILRTVNACLQFLPMLDGKALFTIEDLSRASLTPGSIAALHPVQEAMVTCHGSQCGFCTPGFVMSLTAIYEAHLESGARPTRGAIADALAGNLCRCTGYRAILDAAAKSFQLPAHRLDTAKTVAALQSLALDPQLTYRGPNRDRRRTSQQFIAPRSLDELAALREQMPHATLLAGGTDIGLWVTKQFKDLGDILFLGSVEELQRVERSNTALTIGAGVCLENAWEALAEEWPESREIWVRFAGPPVRNSGTLGGNLANGSPIGDGAPVLMALDAQLILRKGSRMRTVPFDQFYQGYRKNQLEPGEFLQAIRIPRREPGALVRAWKISKRYDCDISAVCAAFALTIVNDRIAQARFAFGGMAATVKRASHTERVVLGKNWTRESVEVAVEALGEDFAPWSDLRASQSYRLQVARALLLRFWLQTRADRPLSADESTVWATQSAS
jgi:xanthine dehydrogenase small subunit